MSNPSHDVSILSSDGMVSTIAGGGSASGVASGYVEGIGRDAYFGSNVENIAIDSVGNLFVGDWANTAIRKITPAGKIKLS